MIKSIVFGLASTLAGPRKYKFALVGIHFAYLGYKLLKKRRGNRRQEGVQA